MSEQSPIDPVAKTRDAFPTIEQFTNWWDTATDVDKARWWDNQMNDHIELLRLRQQSSWPFTPKALAVVDECVTWDEPIPDIKEEGASDDGPNMPLSYQDTTSDDAECQCDGHRLARALGIPVDTLGAGPARAQTPPASVLPIIVVRAQPATTLDYTPGVQAMSLEDWLRARGYNTLG